VVSGGSLVDCLRRPYWPREIALDPLYRPVTTLTLRATYAVFGEFPPAHRCCNAALHGLCAALVALTAMGLWRRAPAAAGLTAGLLFAAHPVNTEAVALVVGRAELLAALFSFWVLCRHIRYVRADAVPSVRYHVTTALLFLLALGSKEHAVFVWPAVAAVDLWAGAGGGAGTRARQRLDRLARSHHLGLMLAAAGFLLVRWLIFGEHARLPAELVNPLADPLTAAPLATQVATPFVLLLLAVRLLVVPVGLCPVWSIGGIELPGTLWRADVVAGAGLAVLLGIMLVAGLRRRWTAAVPLAGAGLFLLLPCHFVPAANWLFAERWLYLPCGMIALLAAGAARYRRVLPVMLVAAAVLFAGTWQYQRNWASNLELFESVVARQPYGYHGLLGYTHELKERDGILAAEPYVSRLVERFPQSPRSWHYQALLLHALDRPARTLEAINRYVVTDGPNLLTPELQEVQDAARAKLERSTTPLTE